MKKQLEGKGDGSFKLSWDSKSIKPDFCDINFLLELGYYHNNPYNIPPSFDDIDKKGWFFETQSNVIVYLWRTDQPYIFQNGYLLHIENLRKWFKGKEKNYRFFYSPTQNPYTKDIAYWTISICPRIEWIPENCYKQIPKFLFNKQNRNVKELIEKNKKGLDKFLIK